MLVDRVCLAVPVYLDAPLWGAGWGRGQLASEMMALCMQLDATIVSHHTASDLEVQPLSSALYGSDLLPWQVSREKERKVTFQQWLPARVAALLGRMAELLQVAGCVEKDVEVSCQVSCEVCDPCLPPAPSLQTYLRESGLGFVFPRVELCLQEPEQNLTRLETREMDSKYISAQQYFLIKRCLC